MTVTFTLRNKRVQQIDFLEHPIQTIICPMKVGDGWASYGDDQVIEKLDLLSSFVEESEY